MTQLLFGSPEANAIREKDKKQYREHPEHEEDQPHAWYEVTREVTQLVWASSKADAKLVALDVWPGDFVDVRKVREMDLISTPLEVGSYVM